MTGISIMSSRITHFTLSTTNKIFYVVCYCFQCLTILCPFDMSWDVSGNQNIIQSNNYGNTFIKIVFAICFVIIMQNYLSLYLS